MADINQFKTVIRWCLLFMTDPDGNLRSADGRKLTPPDDIAEAMDAAYYQKCSVCDGLGYSVGVSKRVPCKSCDGKGFIKDERMPVTAIDGAPIMDKTLVAVFDFDGWKIIQKDEWGGVSTLLVAPDFETLIRNAVSAGYLRPPIAIKLGEMPR